MKSFILQLQTYVLLNLQKAYTLFPPQSEHSRITDFDAIAAELEIFWSQCGDEVKSLEAVAEKSHSLEALIPQVDAWAK